MTPREEELAGENAGNAFIILYHPVNPPTWRERLRASRLNVWWLHPSLWERPRKRTS